jgi:hypothetical protein
VSLLDPRLGSIWLNAVDRFVVQTTPRDEGGLNGWDVGQGWARAAEVLFAALANPAITEDGHASARGAFAAVVGARNRPFTPHPVDLKDALPLAFSAYAATIAVPGKAVLLPGTVPPIIPPPLLPSFVVAWTTPQSDSVVPFANAILNVVRPWLSAGTLTVPAGGVVPWS